MYALIGYLSFDENHPYVEPHSVCFYFLFFFALLRDRLQRIDYRRLNLYFILNGTLSCATAFVFNDYLQFDILVRMF